MLLSLTRATLLLLVCWVSLPAAVQFTILVVDEATWRKDIATGWMQRYLTDRASITWDILLPPHAESLPIPGLDGTFIASAWLAFTASHMNPVKNAVRLLGPPTSVGQTPAGQIEMRWEAAKLRGGRAAGLPADDVTISLVGDESRNDFQWSYTPVLHPDRRRM